jgi:hypothetical protein
LDDIKERRGYSHLKVEALDCTMWRPRFGRGFGPVLIIIKNISTLTYTVWHVDKYKITFKLVISHWTNEMSFSTHSRILFSSEHFHCKMFTDEKCLEN